MRIPQFKRSSIFAEGIKQRCLVAKLRNSQVPTLARRHIEESNDDPIFKVFIRGSQGTELSDWQKGVLQRLFPGEELLTALDKGMREYASDPVWPGYRDEDPDDVADIRRNGIIPYLALLSVVIDEARGEVILATITEKLVNLVEHGIAIHWKENRWKFAYADYWVEYLKTVRAGSKRTGSRPAPHERRLSVSPSMLDGRWIVDEARSSSKMEATRVSKRQIKAALDQVRGLVYEFSEGKFRMTASEGEVVNADVLSCNLSGKELSVTIKYSQHDLTEVWEFEYENGKLILPDWVMMREETSK